MLPTRLPARLRALALALLAALTVTAGLAIAPNDTGGPGVTHAHADGWPHHGPATEVPHV